jgi:glycogen synthase
VTYPVLFARNLFLPEDLGGNRYPYETIRRLGARGHPVTVVTPRLHDRFPRLPSVRYHLYPVLRPHPLISHLTNLVSGTAALRRERGRGHAVALAGSYDAALSIGRLRVAPLVFLFHSEFYSEWVMRRGPLRPALRAYMGLIERAVFGLSQRIVAVSHFSAAQIAERLPSARDRVRVVPTGVETDFFEPAPDRRAARQALGLPTEEPLLLGVGRLAGVKQFDRLVTGFAAAAAQGLAGQLVIAGDGPQRPRLEALIATYGVQERVHLAGYCEPPRLRALMQAADLQVCSSAFENLSLALLEGMACGTPVLGTPGGGTPELVGQIDAGLVLTDDQPHTLAEALPSLLGDRARLAALGQRARQIAVERYDWDRVVDGLEAVLGEAIRA